MAIPIAPALTAAGGHDGRSDDRDAGGHDEPSPTRDDGKVMTGLPWTRIVRDLASADPIKLLVLQEFRLRAAHPDGVAARIGDRRVLPHYGFVTRPLARSA